MNKYCWFCGNKIKEEDDTCENCDAKIFKKRVNVEEREIINKNQKNKENLYFYLTLASIILPWFSPFIGLEILFPILEVASVVLIIYIRKTFHYSKKVKILTYLYLTAILVLIILFIWILIECGVIHPGY